MYVYLGREWELRVIFRLELQFSCWNKYWSLGWLHLKFYQLLDWLLFFSFCWIFNPKDVNVCFCFVFFFFLFPFFFLSLFSIVPHPAFAAPFMKWHWTLVSASLFYNKGAHISDCFHAAHAHARNTKTMADMEMPPIYIHLVFDSSAECEWVLDFISKSIVNSNVSHFRGDILSKHYLSCLFNIKSKHVGICKCML